MSTDGKLRFPQSVDAISPTVTKGRGAISNRKSSRFQIEDSVLIDDGWNACEEEASGIRTVLGLDKSRKVITYTNSPDIGFDRSLNP